MSDDMPPDEPTREAAGEGRDENVAALLEVPPLDDVTRRRLVAGALADAEQRRARTRRVLVPAAAVLIVLVLVGVGAFVLATRGGGGDDGTAARTTTAAPGTQAGAPQAGEADASHAGIPDLGDLGDVTDQSELRRKLAPARRAPAPAQTERAAAPPCLDRALTGSPAPEAFGTGTHRGRPVLVLVLPSGADSTTAVLLDQQTCQAVAVVSLS
jgi:hypothetical protein